MSALPSATLDEFARLIARGLDPREASARAGYPDLRRSRARARLARPKVAARIAELRPGPPPTERGGSIEPHPAGSRHEPERAVADTTPKPPFKHQMTNAEWLEAFAPLIRSVTGADPRPARLSMEP